VLATGRRLSTAAALSLLLAAGACAGCKSDCDRYAALGSLSSDLCRACVRNYCSRQAAASDRALEAAPADKACAEGCEPQERLDCACMARCLTTPAVKAAVDNTYACVVSACKAECR
jgi:hypothetical protein